MNDDTIETGLILTCSAQVLKDLRPGPLRLFLYLRWRAGHARYLITYTQSLATWLKVCTNTIRAWKRELEELGYIWWDTNPRNGQTTIRIREKAEPPSRQWKNEEQRRIDALPSPLPWQPPKPIVMPPDKKPWWKLPTFSKRYLGGAQKTAPIKSRVTAEFVDIPMPF